MPDTTTTNLGLTKPAVGEEAGRNMWGGKWNTNADLIDAAVGTAQDDIATLEANVTDLANDLTDVENAVAALRVVPTGAVLSYAGSTAPTGFVLLRGGTIGDASSSATVRANADTEALFTLLWGSMSDTQAPVSGGRGANAAADFAAHKTITLPDAGGRVIAGKEATASRLTSGTSGVDGGTLGASGGDQRMHQHSHSVTDSGHSHGVTDPQHFHYYAVGGIPANGVNARGTSGDGTNFGYAATNYSATGISIQSGTTGVSIQNAGSGSSQNVQPTLVLNYIIAL